MSENKKINPWVEHVKKYAKEHNISYLCAVSMAKDSYKAPTKVKPEGKRALKEKKEKERIELLETQPHNSDILQDLLEKRRKRNEARKAKESKALHKAYMKGEGDIVDNLYEKFSIEQLKERIELMKKEPKRFTPYPELITDEIKPVQNEIDRKLKLKKQQQQQKEKRVKQKEKEKKDKEMKEKKEAEKELSKVAF